MSNLTEVELWKIINDMGWWFWGPLATLGWVRIWSALRLAPPKTTFGRVTRLIAVFGGFLVGTVAFNTAFGPIGMYLILMASIFIDMQLYEACKKAGYVPTRPQDQPTLALKAAATIVEPQNGHP